MRRCGPLLAAAAALGVLSRMEERVAGFSAGISSSSAWIAFVFAAGATALRTGRPEATAAAGAAALTAANAAYYGWVLLTEPGRDIDFAGRPASWFVLGLAGGAVFAVAGRAWAAGRPAARTAAAVLLGAVLIGDGVPGLWNGRPTDAIGLAVGIAFPVATSPRGLRWAAVGAVGGVAVVAAGGGLEIAVAGGLTIP